MLNLSIFRLKSIKTVKSILFYKTCTKRFLSCRILTRHGVFSLYNSSTILNVFPNQILSIPINPHKFYGVGISQLIYTTNQLIGFCVIETWL